MKHFWMISPLSLFGLILLLGRQPLETPLVSSTEPIVQTAHGDSLLTYPPKIRAIIDLKCYDCHSEKGKDKEAKEELLWDDLGKLSKMDLMYTMDAIVESIEEAEMPPKDYIQDHPKAALTKEEAKLLIEWADGIASKIME